MNTKLETNQNVLDISYSQIVTIILNEKCAEWLKGVMQNPLSDDPNPDNEDPVDKEMRYDLWNALNK